MADTGTGIYFKRTGLEDYFLGIDSTDRKFDFFTVSSIIVLLPWLSLERTWGTFRYNVYIFSGILFTVIAVFILYGVFYLIYGIELPLSSIGLISTNYITMSIFLAFASIYPDMEVLLYFILPIKMKWMAFVYAAMALYYFFTGSLATKVAIAASLLNLLSFSCPAGI